jgi:hypothetical protein
MAKFSGADVRNLARQIIASYPGGIQYGTLVKEIRQRFPELTYKDVNGATWDLHLKFPGEISRPVRAVFMPAGEGAVPIGDAALVPPQGKDPESEFYAPFADWLKTDLNEVTEAVPLGGAGLRARWGTPDVVGTYKPLASNLIKFPIEIVAAEIKTDPQAPVVAFGQAVAYRLFSTKTYIAMPTTLTEADKGRLESLCMLFGVGLVLFDLNKNDPKFSIRMRAQRFSPDMFYVNDFAEGLKRNNIKLFDALFG